MKTEIELTEYTLPVYWSSYLVNGDASGLEDEEREEIDAFTEGLGHCVDVSEDSWFAPFNDANNLGGEVSTYTFQAPA